MEAVGSEAVSSSTSKVSAFSKVVKAAVQEANARTTCYKHAAASIAGLVHT